MHVYEMGVINMLNAEKYKNEILEKSNVVFDFSISKDRHTIEKCLGVCDNCIFCNMGEHCSNVKVKWLLSEYKEPVKVSSLEHELLKYWYESGCCYRYIARDSSGNLFLYVRRPTKKAEVWASIEWHKFISDFNDLFKFVKWEDEEPTSIDYVLNNCEVVEDDL